MHIPLIRQTLYLVGFVWHKIVEIMTGISIPYSVKIGKGLYIGHFAGIYINEDVVIGENCNLSQGVTIGVGGRDKSSESPSDWRSCFYWSWSKAIWCNYR